MGIDISKLNYMYLKEWMNLNPKLKNLRFNDNTIVPSSDDAKPIPLGSFLLQDLLYNPAFSKNIYTMSEKSFIKILLLHRKAQIILDDTIKFNDTDYIRYIYANDNGYAVLLTSGMDEIVVNSDINSVLKEYDKLLEQYANYVPVSAVLAKFSKYKKRNADGSVNITNIKFFDLLNKDKLTEKRKAYITKISDFIYTLFVNQDYLVGDAKDLFNKYIYVLESINNYDTKTELQQYACDKYKRIKDDYSSLIDEIFEKERKEEVSLVRTPSGYSSIVLIITSIIISGLFIAMVILK